MVPVVDAVSADFAGRVKTGKINVDENPMTSYAANGTREQHRAYFDESGSLIYHDRRRLKGPGYFGPQVEELKKLVEMDPQTDFAEATQGCREVKASAKHRARKS